MLTRSRFALMLRATLEGPKRLNFFVQGSEMKVRSSIKSLAKRHRDNRVIRRRGRIMVINKVNKRFKARQG